MFKTAKIAILTAALPLLAAFLSATFGGEAPVLKIFGEGVSPCPIVLPEEPSAVQKTAAEELEFYLELFIALYPGHRDLMRFDQDLSIYIHRIDVTEKQLSPMLKAIALYGQRFHALCRKAGEDGTLRGDLSEKELYVMSINIMLSLAGRCAVDWIDPADRDRDVTGELRLLREMILRTCISREGTGPAEENRKI